MEVEGGSKTEKHSKERKREERKRNIQKETGGPGVMETHPHHCSLQEEGIQFF